MRKWIVILGVAVLVVVGAVALVAVNLNSYLNENENRDWVASQAESALGRSVSFGKVGISLLGGLGVRVEDLRIGDDPAFSKEPFVSADVIDLRVAILPALFGDIEVGRVMLRSPSITVIQTAQGLSTDSLGGGAEPATPEETASSTEEATQTGGLPAFVVAVVDISDGTLRFINKTSTPAAESAIEKLDFRASNVSLTGPIGFELKAAVLGAGRQNIRIAGQVVDLENPKADFTLTSRELELAPGAGDVPPDTLRDLELTGRLSLPKAGPHIQAKVRSPRGTIAGAAYTDLAVDFALQNQVATIEKLSAAAFDGEIGRGATELRRSPDALVDARREDRREPLTEVVALHRRTARRQPRPHGCGRRVGSDQAEPPGQGQRPARRRRAKGRQPRRIRAEGNHRLARPFGSAPP